MTKIKRALLLVCLLAGFCRTAEAQSGTTQASATVLDPTGSPYAGCHASVAYVPSPSAQTVPTINGGIFQTVIPVVQCDSFAHFTVTLADNNMVSDGHTTPPASQWNFSINSQDGLTGFQCQMTITGNTQDVSSQIQACAAPLPAHAGGGGAFVVKAVPCASSMAFTMAGNAPISANTAFTVLLNCNVVTSTVVGAGPIQVGSVAQFTLTQNSAGGSTFNWPANFIDKPTIVTSANGTTNASFWFDGTNWHAQTFPASGGGGGSGSAGAQGIVQIANSSGGFAVSGLTDDGTNLTIDREMHPKGPDPYADVTRTGARTIAIGSAPAVPGITANCSGTTATLSLASTFQNGDGVVLYGCGTANGLSTPSAPTVVPSQASGATGTGVVVNSPTGSTSYTYSVVAFTKTGGYTVASTPTTITNGLANLGSQSVAITSCSRSGVTVTCTTAAHGLPVGCSSSCPVLDIVGTVDGSFAGFYKLDSVSDSTHFSYISGFDTDSGATASSTGGTAFYFNCNHITWPHVTNAYMYGVYSGTALLSLTIPDNFAAGAEQLFWDDFGSTMSGGFLAPYYVPTTPPGSPSANYLSTTIVSGAGTTTLTLANAATTSISSTPILFDDAPAILTALSANPTAYLPTGSDYYVINSHLIMPGTSTLCINASPLYLNDTIEISSQAKISGSCFPKGGGSDSFEFESNPVIFVNRAFPGLYDPNGSGSLFSHFTVNGVSGRNGDVLAVIDGSQNAWDTVTFQDGGGASDYMGMNFVARGGTSGILFNNFRNMTFTGGPGNGTYGSTMTPLVYLSAGNAIMDNVSMDLRGIYITGTSNGTGGYVTFKSVLYNQGPITPLIYTGGPNNGSVVITLDSYVIDTGASPLFAALNASFSGSLNIRGYGNGPSSAGGGPPPLISGFATPSVGISIGPGYDSNIIGSYFSNSVVSVTGLGEFIFSITNNTAPGVAVSAGGAVPIGNITYGMSVFDINGNESLVSPLATAVTTSGNQTVTITPSVPSGAVSWRPWRGGSSLICSPIPFGAPYVDTLGFTCGQSFPTINRAGSQTLGAAGLSGTAINLVGGGFKDVISGTYTANRTRTDPDVSGTWGVLAGAFNDTDCLQAHKSGSILSIISTGATCGGGGGGATFQVNGVNTSNQTTINFQNSAAFNGLTATFSNPSVGNVQLGFSGTLGNAGLTNSSVTVNTAAPLGGGGAVSLGGTLNLTCTACTAPTFQTNGVNNANQGLLNFINPSTFNGLTFSYSNPSGGNETFTVGGTLGNAGLTNPAITIAGTSVALGSSTSSLPSPGPIGGTTPSTGAFTTLSASSTVSGAGFSAFLASPPAIGGTAPAAGTFTTLTANTSLVINGGTALTTTNQSGTGSICLTTNCALVTPNLGTPSAITLTNGTGLPLAGLGGEVNGDVIAGVSGAWTATAALPNGITATTQTTGDNTNKVATDAFVIANSSIPTLPVGPNGIPQTLTSTPSGGVGQPPTWSVPGVPIDAQTGTSYSIPITDDVHFLTGSNGSATAWTGFALANNYVFSFENLGTGLITYTPASGTVNGNATQIIPQNWFGFHYTDNTNTFMPVLPTIQAFGSTCGDATHALAFNASTGAFSCQSITASATAGGLPTQIQYNNATALGGITNFTSNGTNPFLSAIAAPATPASGFDVMYEDSTDLRFHDKNASGTIGTTVVANSLASHNFVNAVSAAGVVSGARPACADLSDSAGGCTMSTTAGGDLSGTLPSPTVAQVNGAVVPTSAAVLGSNSSKQLIAATPHSVVAPLQCSDTSGSATTQSCSTTPTFSPAKGDAIIYYTTTQNSGGLTVNVNSAGAANVQKWQGTALSAGDLKANIPVMLRYDGTNWQLDTTGLTSGSGGVCLTTNCVMTTPNLGTPSALVLTNATGLPNGGLVNSAITIAGTSVSLGGSTSSFPSPGAIGGTTPSTGAFTTLTTGGLALTTTGVFTGTQANQPFTSITNGLNPDTEFQAAEGSGKHSTDGFVSAILVPNTAGVLQANAISAYCSTNQTFTPTACLSFYAQARALVNGAGVWGGDFVAWDTSGLTSGVNLIGFENDMAPQNAPSAYSAVLGFLARLNAKVTGTFPGTGFKVTSAGVAGSQYTNAFLSDDGSAQFGLIDGAACTSGTCNSMPIVMRAQISSASHATYLLADGTGNILTNLDAGANHNLVISGVSQTVSLGATTGTTLTAQTTVTAGSSGTAGSFLAFPASGNFTTTWGSAATASNTILGFATAPTTGDLVKCVTASTTCTLTDAGILGANVVLASSPGAGIAHFAGSTQTVTSSPIVAADITSATITGTQLAASLALTTPNIGAATGTSLYATGIIDGKATVNVSTTTPCTLGTASSNCSAVSSLGGYTVNEHATAATAITYNLPTAAAGLQYCVANGFNGTAANTGVLTVATSASGQFIIFTDGTLTATGGNITSGGAGGDAACVVGVDSTHWMLYVNRGTWTKH